MFKSILSYKTPIAIGVLWLFHISAIIGIILGYEDWFIEKTPINLYVSLVLFVFVYPLKSWKQWALFSTFFIGGMFTEWLGVQYQLLFGDYVYGSNFGYKVDGVPLLIGFYWALLTFITSSIMAYTKLHRIAKIIGGALLMVILDFFMEHSAPYFDFWTFEENKVPLENYVTWFFLALLFHMLLSLFKSKGNKAFALHLYLAQLLFFVFFYFY